MYLSILLLILPSFASVHYSEPVELVDSLQTYYGSTSFLTLDHGSVIFVNSEEQICIMDVTSEAEPEVFECHWVPGTPEWRGNTNTLLQDISQDGATICFTQQVSFPDSMQVYDSRIPGPVIVAVCNTDGSDARIVALSFDIGGSPDFHFTNDSKYLFGGVILRCQPNASDYAEYVTRDDDTGLISGHLIDVGTGDLVGDCQVVANDGYYANPWSDLAATGAYPTTKIVDVIDQEIIFEDSSLGQNGIISRWVLPDAGLAYRDGEQILLHADGSVVRNEGPDIRVYEVLFNGRYIFSYDDGGDNIKLGNIDWNTFQSPDAIILGGLEEYDIDYCKAIESIRGNWLIFVDGNAMYSYELP